MLPENHCYAGTTSKGTVVLRMMGNGEVSLRQTTTHSTTLMEVSRTDWLGKSWMNRVRRWVRGRRQRSVEGVKDTCDRIDDTKESHEKRLSNAEWLVICLHKGMLTCLLNQWRLASRSGADWEHYQSREWGRLIEHP